MIEATKLGYARRLREATGGGKRSVGKVFRTFTTMAACALAAGSREDEYLKAIKGYEREEIEALCEAYGLLVWEMEEYPYRDLLGPLYAEVGTKGDRDFRGEFYTPWSVCDFLAALQLGAAPDDWPKDRPVTFLEPAGGSGGVVLSLAREMVEKDIPLARARFTLWDVAKVACDMAYVNLSLWGVPATVVWGNSLTQEVYGSWRTVFWPGEAAEAAEAGESMQDGEEADGEKPEGGRPEGEKRAGDDLRESA